MSARPQRRRHFSGAGLAYVVVVALLGLGALNSQNNMLFFAFGLALAGALVSGVASGAMLLGLSVTRTVPRTGAVGAPMHVGYRVRNRWRFTPIFAVGLAELPTPARPGERTAPEAELPAPRAFLPHIAPRSATRVNAVVVPTRRGMCTFGALRVRTSFPFGITRKSVTFRESDALPAARCLVRPEPAPVLKDALRRAVSSSYEGDAAAATVGPGDEFFSLREYAPGDSARQIAWRASARTGTLVVRENAARSPLRVWVAVLPAPAKAPDEAPGADRLNERAVSLAAGLVLRIAQDGAEVGLAIPTGGVLLPPRHGARHIERLLDALALVDLHQSPSETRLHGAAARSGAWVVVHAGEGRPGALPPRAVVVGAARPEGFLDPADLEGSVTWR